MPTLRYIVLLAVLALATSAFAQPATVEELAHALNTDAFVVDEPLGASFDCEPYREVFPEGELSCFELYMPAIVLRGRFQSYVGEVEDFTWAEDAWVDVEVLPGHVDPDDDHIRRTIVSAQGRTYVVVIFDVGPLNQVVVASESE